MRIAKKLLEPIKTRVCAFLKRTLPLKRIGVGTLSDEQLLEAFKRGIATFLYSDMFFFHNLRVNILLDRATKGCDYQPMSQDERALPLESEYDPYWLEIGAFIVRSKEKGLQPEQIYGEIRQWATSTNTHLKTA